MTGPGLPIAMQLLVGAVAALSLAGGLCTWTLGKIIRRRERKWAVVSLQGWERVAVGAQMTAAPVMLLADLALPHLPRWEAQALLAIAVVAFVALLGLWGFAQWQIRRSRSTNNPRGTVHA